jgi:CBS domain-containing protein
MALDGGCTVLCLVVEEQGKLWGILTDRDIALRVVGQGKDPRLTHVGAAMTPNLVRIPVDNALHELTMLKHSQHVRRVPVIDMSGQTIGVATLDDLLVLFDDEMSDLAKTVAEAFFRQPANVEAEPYHWWATSP